MRILRLRHLILGTTSLVLMALLSTPAQAQWIQSAQLTPSPGQSEQFFGEAIAINGDTMVVGAPAYPQSSNAVYVFSEISGVWTQVAKLTPSDLSNGLNFGYAVAISANTIVVGDVPLCCTSTSPGAAYVFQKPLTGWVNMTQTAKLTDGSASFDGFGSSVAISGDTIAVGVPSMKVAENKFQGAVDIFVKPAFGWTDMTPTAQLLASDGTTNDELGATVAMQGNTVVAAADLSIGAGTAYVFVSPNGVWTSQNETAKLTASDGNFEDDFGRSLAVSAGESTIIIGAPGHLSLKGAAYIFTKPATGWQSVSQTSELPAPGPSRGFGMAVATNGPGTIMAVGAPFTGSSIPKLAGTAFVYRKPASGWPSISQANAKINPPSPQQNGFFGSAVAVRATAVAIGEFDANVNGNIEEGAVYVFDRP